MEEFFLLPPIDMVTHDLPYAQIHILEENMAELIVREGLEMSEKDVEHFHEFLKQQLTSPFCVLVNRRYVYSYSFQAQKILATIPELKAVAVVVYSNFTEKVVQHINTFPTGVSRNIQVFRSRETALHWLLSQMKE